VIHQVDIKFIKLTVCTAKKKKKKNHIYIYIYPTIIVARPCDPNVGEAVAVLPAVNR